MPVDWGETLKKAGGLRARRGGAALDRDGQAMQSCAGSFREAGQVHEPLSIGAVQAMLGAQGYVCGRALGTVTFLALTLGTVKERIEAMQNEANREHPRGQFDTGRIPSVTGPVQDFKVDRTFRPENKKYEGKRERIGSASVVARLARNKISSCHARQSRGSRIRVRLNRVNESISVSDGRPGGGAPGMALGKFVDYAGRNFSPEHSLNKMS